MVNEEVNDDMFPSDGSKRLIYSSEETRSADYETQLTLEACFGKMLNNRAPEG